MDVEDLEVYQRLCKLHIEVCDLRHDWPQEERYELGSQVRRSSNSSPAQLAEKHDDRHIRNKIEGVNRSRGEAGETIHTENSHKYTVEEFRRLAAGAGFEAVPSGRYGSWPMTPSTMAATSSRTSDSLGRGAVFGVVMW